jgi:2-octaprenyl-3-methyl-6-methoxy-1,4-benzoquinol hydroxylase
MTEVFDITIIGGGMVGAAAALGLARQGKKVALVEGAEPEAFAADQPMDTRVSAISHTSVALLRQLGAWDATQAMRVCPYSRLETWEFDECRVHFDAASLGIDELGFIVENRLIQLGLWQQFSAYPQLKVLCPERLEKIIPGKESNNVILASGTEIQSSLIIGADGANSKVRQQCGIGVTAWDYRQHCMLINVETELPQQDITWQWFTPSGPRAFLPLPGNQGSLVWYDSPQRIRQLSQMTPVKLAKEIAEEFPDELQGIKVLSCGSFPLTRRHAQAYHKARCVLVGDAAHTINPLAGQGVNLGFKDVKALLDVLDGESWDSDDALNRYERKRRPDNLLMQTGMDLFYKGFSNDHLPLKLLRNAVLKATDNAGVLKKQILKYAVEL